jgi:hypothetical protein
VLADGKVVGRIYDDGSSGTPPELRWFWSITCPTSEPRQHEKPDRRADDGG